MISVPAAILSALSAAARGGVLFKGGGALETLAAVDTFAFDKTGTLTNGRAEVTRIVALDGEDRRFLSLFAGLEAHSEHHIAAAIRREALVHGVEPAAVVDVTSHPSAGIVGYDTFGPIWAGNAHLVGEMGASVDHVAFRELADSAQTVVYLGRGATVLGAVSVADEARASSAPALAALRAGGINRIVMMTGDRRPVALRIGAELGLAPDEFMPRCCRRTRCSRSATSRVVARSLSLAMASTMPPHWLVPMSASRWERRGRTSHCRPPTSPCCRKT